MEEYEAKIASGEIDSVSMTAIPMPNELHPFIKANPKVCDIVGKAAIHMIQLKEVIETSQKRIDAISEVLLEGKDSMETALEGGYTRKDLDLFIDTVIRAEGISVKNMTPEEANQFVEKMKEGEW